MLAMTNQDSGRTVGAQRRFGDAKPIAGDYQHRARTSGNVVQRFWHAEKERMIRRYCPPSPGDRVLDIGCGSGVIADVLASFGADVVGIDGNAEAIDYARRTFTRLNVDFRQGLVDDVDEPDGSVDRIYCLEVIEHLYGQQVSALISSFARLLRPGGTVCLTTPNFRGAWLALEWMLDRFHMVQTLGEEQHVSRFARDSLRAQFNDSQWRVRQLTTFCTVAPFASLLGWRFAEVIARHEGEIDLPFGSLLFVVAERR